MNLSRRVKLVVDFAIASWERDNIPNIAKTSYEEDHKVKPQSETRVLHSSISSKIKVPFILLAWQAQLVNSAIQCTNKKELFHVSTKKNRHHSSTVMTQTATYTKKQLIYHEFAFVYNVQKLKNEKKLK